jgi:hypothetical protein
MSIKNEFVTLVQKHFEGLTPLLDEEIIAVCANDYSEDVRFFLVEYDSPHFSEDFSVSLWPMDGHGQPVGDGHWFLKGKAVAVPPEIYEAERFESIDPWSVASGLLEEWFIKTWQKNARHFLPAFIAHHDSYFKRNTQTGKQINWDEIIASVSK